MAQPSGLYFKAHTGDPGEDATANAAGETTRQQVTFGTAASGGSISNTAEAEWTNVSTTETWTHGSIWDAATGGNPLFKGALTAGKALTAGEDAKFAVGDLTLTLD